MVLPAKYDIRTWSPDHTKMGKGITLTNEEFQVMLDAFKIKKGSLPGTSFLL